MFSQIERAALVEAARPLARMAFAALIVLSPFRVRIELLDRPSPPVYGDYTDFLIFWSDAALLLTLALWAISLAARPGRSSISVGPPFLAVPVAGLVLVAIAGVPSAVDPALSAWNVVRLIALVGVALYAINEIDAIAQLRVPIAAMLAIQVLVVVVQVAAQHQLGLQGIGEHDLSPALPVSVVTAADGSRLLRGYGLSDHPNILGGLLAFASLLLLGARRSTREPIGAVDLFALGMVGILLTFSRAAMLGLAVGLVVLIGMLATRRDRVGVRQTIAAVVIGLVACLPFALAYLPYLDSRADASSVVATEVRSIDEREVLMAATNEVFVARPLLGVGLGGLPLALRDLHPDLPYPYQPAHVVFLDVAAETGVAGAMLFLVIAAIPWLAMLRHRPRWTPELAAASAALAALTVVGLFDYYTWTYPAGRIWMWVILGLWAGSYRRALAKPIALRTPRETEGVLEPAAAHA